jgi:hypothetical protein
MIPIDKFRMGYFILYKNTGGIFGNAIVKRQLVEGFNKEDAQFTHIEISGGEIHSVNISPPVSKLIEITKVHKGEYCRLVKYRNSDYENGLRYKVAYFSATLCNKGYDVQGIFAFLFKWIKQNNRLFFCSEGAAYSLQKVFPDALAGKIPDTVMPADFTNPFFFEMVWEGIIE